MAQSLARIIIHVIFSTKNRKPMIAPAIRDELNAYLAGVLKHYGCSPIEINCPPDHAHILCCLSKNHALAEIIEEVKKGSSRWVKTKSPLLSDFYWQGGYASSSVSQSNVEVVRRYIRSQDSHHHRTTFEDELRAFLRRHQIAYDERYVWD